MLPALLSDSVHPSMLAFVIVYGLDWVATVPPTAALCAEAFGEAGTIVFGWVFAAHQIGAALASVGAGYIRDLTSDYTMAWLGAAGLCAVAALMSLGIRKVPRAPPPTDPNPGRPAHHVDPAAACRSPVVRRSTRLTPAADSCEERTWARLPSSQ